MTFKTLLRVAGSTGGVMAATEPWQTGDKSLYVCRSACLSVCLSVCLAG